MLRTADHQRVYGVITAEDRTDTVLIDSEGVEGRALAMLRNSFPNTLVSPLSWSRDAKLLLFRIDSDRNSGEYYLYDTATKKARFLLARDEWLDPEQMQARTPIEFNARDGLQLHGYLTCRPSRG